MKNEGERINRSLFSIRNYLIFFLLISFTVTCSFLLFLKTMDFDVTDIRASAIGTFINILFLSLLFSIIDSIRRKYMVERPVKRILQATRQLTQGDFTARIEPIHDIGRTNEFDAIIEDFNLMAEELSGIETLRTDFTASVSHELKTPLAIIQNYATMLQMPDLAEEKRLEYAAAIISASKRFSELITNILKLNKLENQRIFPEAIIYNLGEQLRACILDFEDVLEKKNLNVDIEINDLTVKADPELLVLVWNNLFSNAVKFTEPGGVLTINLTDENGYAVVTVSDTGCGMTAEVGSHIFEKFYQGETSHAIQGNGLGLPLVKRVVDILSGEISVSSHIGAGSTFTVKLWRDVHGSG